MKTFDFSDELVALQTALNHFALKLTSNREDAEDLTQDTFLKAIAFQKQFEESTNLRAWTYTIMKNTFINHYRKQARQGTVLDKSVNLFLLNQTNDTCYSAPDSMLREKEIHQAIDNLEYEFKVPFMMYVQGYKYKDIADILELKIGTVKSRIFFTRKKLAKELFGYH